MYHLKFLGPEPLTKDFNINYVHNYFLNKKTKIKNLLMNQKFIAGLGNIYCNEILFLCKINPNKIAKKISKQEQIEIIKFTKKICTTSFSINPGGTSARYSIVSIYCGSTPMIPNSSCSLRCAQFKPSVFQFE